MIWIFCWLAFASLIETNIGSVSVLTDSTLARKETQEKAQIESVLKASEELLGPQQFLISKEKLGTQLIKDSANLVQSVKNIQFINCTKEASKCPSASSDAHGLSYFGEWQIRISREALRSYLGKNGYFNSSEQNTIVLSKVIFKQDNEVYIWNSREKSSRQSLALGQLHNLFLQVGESVLRKNGFFLFNPNFEIGSSKNTNPQSGWVERGPMNWDQISGAQIFANGLVQIKGKEVSLKIKLDSPKNQKVYAEIAKSGQLSEIENLFSDSWLELGSQIKDSWQKGSLGISRYRLKVSSILVSKKIDSFKKLLSEKLDSSAQWDKKISNQFYILEFESSLNKQSIIDRLKYFEWDGIKFKAQIDPNNQEEVLLNELSN